MATYRIGDRELNLEVVGVGLRGGLLPPPAQDLTTAFSLRERRDLDAFRATGWRFQQGTDLDWRAVQEFNGGAPLAPGLLARHPSGSLVIIRDKIVLQFRPGITAGKVEQRLSEYLRSRRLGFSDNLFEAKLRLPSQQLEETVRRELRALLQEAQSSIGEVVFAEPSLIYHLRPEWRVLNEPYPQWHWDQIELEAAWRAGGERGRGRGTRVAVIDLGFHVDDPQISRSIEWRVRLNQEGEVVQDSFPTNSHGTLCAGLIAAAEDRRDVSGAAPDCKLGLVAIEFGVCSQAGLGRALELCADPSRFDTGLSAGDGADVVSCSLGLPASSWELGDALRSAIDTVHTAGRGGKGAPVAWACFNADEEIKEKSVEAYTPLIVASQCNEINQRKMSGWGKGLDLLAPGYGVFGIVWEDAVRRIRRSVGSSLAAPCVAGVAALVLAVNPNLTWKQVAEVLTTSCDPIDGQTGWSEKVGWGRLNAKKAVKRAMEMREQSQREVLSTAPAQSPPHSPPPEPPAPPG